MLKNEAFIWTARDLNNGNKVLGHLKVDDNVKLIAHPENLSEGHLLLFAAKRANAQKNLKLGILENVYKDGDAECYEDISIPALNSELKKMAIKEFLENNFGITVEEQTVP
jgi:hypothetical protein